VFLIFGMIERRRNRVTRLQKRFITKVTALFLTMLLFQGEGVFSFFFSQQNHERKSLGKLFRWAAMDFQSGKYRQAIENLELLMSYFDESDKGEKAEEHTGEKNELKGKTYLLLGAAYEKLGGIEEAREFYRLSRAILENPEIEGVDLSDLLEYQRIIMEKKKPVKPGIIEKPVIKPKKKRPPLVLFIMGAAVVVIAAVLLLKKKKKALDNNGDREREPGLDSQLGIEWILITGYETLMGDNFNEGDADEQPVHTVYLDRYHISRHEVTFSQYDRFCEDTGRPKPSDNGWGRGTRPVINVTWGDAAAFCRWLSGKTGKNIRLPTEAQWERAARGGYQSRYPWGNFPPDCEIVNYNCHNQTQPVGYYILAWSIYGTFDMAGNVSEWCRDVYDANFYSISPRENPFNAITGTGEQFLNFVIRGGSWDSSEEIGIRSADRWYGGYYVNESLQDLRPELNTKSPTIGFRLVMEFN
jgi:formylglycine-generating enzyme required for sulfatase activity